MCSVHQQPGGPRKPTRGVVLLALLVALALGGIALMAAVDTWSLARQREREQQLLFVGDQYRQAILRYYLGAPPAAPRTFPASLDQLLEDDRYPMPVRHLRRLYPDPISGGGEWGVLRIGDRISGIYSLSDKRPIKQAGFASGYQHFDGSNAYRDWLFAVTPQGRPSTTPVPRAGTTARASINPSHPPTPDHRTPP
jgi:type II secretory pathway pseudopilin PulG